MIAVSYQLSAVRKTIKLLTAESGEINIEIAEKSAESTQPIAEKIVLVLSSHWPLITVYHLREPKYLRTPIAL